MSASLVAVLVSAAISLKAPLEDAAKKFQEDVPGEEIAFAFGASGQLAAQIDQGAPVDLFVSAAPADIERLVVAHRLDAATRTLLAGNRLVVVVPRGTGPLTTMAGLAAPRFARLAIGNVKTVPAGRYAREALSSSGVLASIEKRLVYGENARQVVDLVARGEADAGIVYATDVTLGGDAIAAALEVPENLYAPIFYETAVVAGAKSSARARAFLDFLASPAGRTIFLGHGFLPPRVPAAR
jgi:molybdate transport system substrate-binding protein